MLYSTGSTLLQEQQHKEVKPFYLIEKFTKLPVIVLGISKNIGYTFSSAQAWKATVLRSVMKKYCLTLDLKDDLSLIREYDLWHRQVWLEVIQSIRDSGILHMEIYRVHTRLFMIMETSDAFSFEKKAELDRENRRVQEWENLMWNYQQPLPWAVQGEKWVVMDNIFSLSDNAGGLI